MIQKLKKHLLYLGTGEIAAALLFLYIQLLSDLGISSSLALLLCIFILFQGGVYWLYRLFTLGRNGYELIVKPILIFFKWLNLILFLLVLVVLLFLNKEKPDLWGSLVIYLFAIIEYINYFWYRLSYGKSGFNILKLKKTGLVESNIQKLISEKR